MIKYSIFVVLGSDHIVVQNSNKTRVFSGTLEECNNFINKSV